jgi:hypothetical protein
VCDLASRECIGTITEVLHLVSTSAQLLAAAGLSPPRFRAQLSVDDDNILLTPRGDGSATCLGTSDNPVFGRWVFDNLRRMWSVRRRAGGPARIELVE